MKALVQRVSRAAVEVEGRTVAEIGTGLLVFVCAELVDGPADVAKTARKVVNLRIFEDEAGRMNLGLRDVGGAILAVSQFTLAADVRRGNRPSFTGAAPPEIARELFDSFVEAVRAHEVPVKTGVFGAKMRVQLVNEGPVTIWIDSARL
ncbi:D-aminoacyl-tRNA deacylase [bacterium HR39]|nr:D-aminoacyl-tRNA deacylase [bacterium HR39]